MQNDVYFNWAIAGVFGGLALVTLVVILCSFTTIRTVIAILKTGAYYV